MAIPFLTKLLVPRRNATVLRRPRLIARLQGASEGGGVIVVQGPAGFGKTTLLVDFCEDVTSSVFWLSLDAWDRDPAIFTDYLRLCLSGDPSSDGSSSAGLGPPDTLAILAEASNRLAALPSGAHLIIDDLHFLDGADDVLAIIDRFIQRMPPNVNLFLLSRTSPSLTSLPRLRAAGKVIEISPAELLFSREEACSLWRNFDAPEPSGDQIDAMLRLTEGWPAAITLLRESGAQGGLRAPGDHLANYLAAEVFDNMPDNLRTFLLRTSVLEQLDIEVCAGLLESWSNKEVRAVFEKVESSGIPATRLTSPDPIVRLHPLVREFLCARLKQSNEKEFRLLHRLAGNMLAARGSASEAVNHFAGAHDWRGISETVEKEAPGAYRAGRWQTILTWLEIIPEKVRRVSPAMTLWEVRILSRLGETDKALRLIDAIIVGLDASDQTLAELEALRAGALRLKGAVGLAVQAAQRSKSLAVAANAGVGVLLEAQKQLALALIARGAFGEAIAELKPVLEMEIERGDTAAVAFVHGCLGSAYGALGRLPSSAHHLEQSRDRWRELNNKRELSWVLNNLGMTYWQLGSDAAAKDTFAECIARSRESGNERAEGYALASLGDGLRFGGQLLEANGRYREAIDLAHQLGDEVLETFAQTGLADVERREGNLATAERLAREASASASDREASLEEGLAAMVLAQVLRDQGRRSDAIESFMDAERRFEQAGASKEQAETLVLLAESLLASRTSRSVLAGFLHQLPTVVAQIGSSAVILRYPDEAKAVARHAIARGISADFYRSLLSQLAVTGEEENPPSRHPSVSVQALGRFEVKVGGRDVTPGEWQGEKSKELLLQLLIAKRPLTRDEIIAALWPDHDSHRARSLFHTTLHRARNALYADSIVELGGAYLVQPAGVFRCDVVQFRRLATDARSLVDRDALFQALMDAVDLYGGPLAPNIKSEWAEDERRDLENTFLSLAMRLADELLLSGRPREAAGLYERVANTDPLDEAACSGAIRAHMAAGDRGAAERAYRRHQAKVQEELGREPSADISELYLALKQQTRSA